MGAPPHRADHELALGELRRLREALAHARHRDVVTEFDQRLTLGQRAADGFAAAVGSWRFIIIQTVILVAWIILNVTAWIRHWDPYPFILLNLTLSFQAAYAAPIIMMSQNRTSAFDRAQAHADYDINQKAEAEIEEVLTLLRRNAAALERLEQQLSK
ncbi:MAG: DUF1003 domain-containing protein [Egibacteraceae bacterium]